MGAENARSVGGARIEVEEREVDETPAQSAPVGTAKEGPDTVIYGSYGVIFVADDGREILPRPAPAKDKVVPGTDGVVNAVRESGPSSVQSAPASTGTPVAVLVTPEQAAMVRRLVDGALHCAYCDNLAVHAESLGLHKLGLEPGHE